MAFNVADQSVVVVGAGRSGQAAALLLQERGARVTLTDTAAMNQPEAFEARGIDVEVGPHRADLLAGADLVVVSPGVPLDQPALAAAREAGRPIIGELELASRWTTGRVIAITGTKGKSTTTTLAARMLVESGATVLAGGNLGVPLSAQVAEAGPSTIHVVEASSFQLETTDTFHPWIAVLLNLRADHLDRHGTVSAYAAAKTRLFANQTADDWAVVNADDAGAMAIANGCGARRFDFSVATTLEHGVMVDGADVVRRDAGVSTPLFPVASVRVPGRHLLADVLAAAAVACLAGVSPAAMRRAVEAFGGLPHALEHVASHRGVRFVNDSKATNVLAAAEAIESFEEGGVVAILGGRFKGGDFAELRDVVRARAVAVVALGEAAPLIHAALADLVAVFTAATMREAVRRGFTLAPRHGVVLLAPACASFDMFEDYADRGRAFAREVQELIRGASAPRADRSTTEER